MQEHTVDPPPTNLGALISEIRISRDYQWALALLLLSTFYLLVWLVVDSCTALAEHRGATQEPLSLGLALSVFALGSSPAATPGMVPAVPARLGLALLALALMAWSRRELRRSFMTSVWFGEGGLCVRVGASRVEIPWTDVRKVGVVTSRGIPTSLIFETPHGDHRLPDYLQHRLFVVLLFACRDRGLIDNDALPFHYRASSF